MTYRPGDPRPLLVLVVGMHRSGTSLVARGLAAMGLNLGEHVDTAAHPANPHGHWEHAEVWRAQEELLIRFGREWHSSPGPLPNRWLEWPDTAAMIERFVALAAAEFDRCGHWVVKDPRSSLLIPAWREVARRTGCELRLLRLVRDAEDVAASLGARDGMPRERALRIWADHQQAIDRDAAGLPLQSFRHVVLLREPLATFTAMGAWCKLADAASRAAGAAALVDPGLWHHRSSTQALGVDLGAASGGSLVTPPPDRGRVLVVMRTRWRLHMLPRAIRSVLSQTYSKWYLQIVNDGGPAHLVEADVAPYRYLLAGRLGMLHHDRQRGMEAASNAGIAAGPGDVIAIHDDDDSWSPEFLERMLAWMHESGHDAAVGRSRLVHETWDGRSYVRRECVEFGPTVESITASDLADHNIFPPIAFLFRRAVYDAVGPFHEQLPALGDWHFNRRVAARRTIGVFPETLADWHLRDPGDQAPNSSRLDHIRMEPFVRAWPQAGFLPPFFSEARQVRLWVDAGCLADVQRFDVHAPLPPGLYLLQCTGLRGVDGHADAVHYRTGAGFADAQVVPVAAGDDGPTTILLNATEPVLALGVGPRCGEVRPLPAPAEALRLGDQLDALDDFAGPPRLPDVLCIGAQRAGTTWLHAMLERHPQIWACGIKEFHQFDWDGAEPALGAFRQAQAIAIIRAAAAEPDRQRSVRRALRHGFPPAHSWENYAAVFDGAPLDRLVCDSTPAYATLDERAVADIARMMPDMKVIFSLRDPVTRAISGGLHHLQRAGVSNPTEEALRAACFQPANELRTDYVRTLDIWQRLLPAERLLVLFHDEIAHDPDRVIERTCGFLGLDSRALRASAEIGIPCNTGAASCPWPAIARVKVELSRRWLPMLVELERRFGAPVTQWRRAAETRLRAADQSLAGARSGLATTVDNNLAQWDLRDAWSQDGDEWDGQARACGVSYDDWKAGIMARYHSLVARGGTVLEIGPGHGRWSELLIVHAGVLVLCDISPNCLDACRHRLVGRGRLRTHLSAAADLPADLTGAVDAVWSYDCLVHVGPEEFRRYVAEIGRVLRPGGAAVLHHADRPKPGFVAHAARLFGRLWPRGRPSVAAASDDHGWRSNVSRRDVRGWAAAAGLVVERQESTWPWQTPHGAFTIGVPRFGDAITILRRP